MMPPTTLRAERLDAGLAKLVVIVQFGHQPPEVVGLPGKLPPHLRFEELELVGEPQGRAGEHDGRAELRRQGPFVPGHAQLPQQAGQAGRCACLSARVGDRVQPDVEGPAALPVERVQPADGAVPLQNADPLAEMRQADARRQPRHARADDDRVVHASIVLYNESVRNPIPQMPQQVAATSVELTREVNHLGIGSESRTIVR